MGSKVLRALLFPAAAAKLRQSLFFFDLLSSSLLLMPSQARWPAPHGKTEAKPGWPDPELKQDSHAADQGQSGLCEGQIIFRWIPY